MDAARPRTPKHVSRKQGPCPRDRHRRRGSVRAAGARRTPGHAVRRRPDRAHRHRMRAGAGRAGDRRRRAVGDPAAQPRGKAQAQGHRPYRADPRDIRRARGHRRGSPASRARASRLPAEPARAQLDPPRAPARRLRLPRRPGRDADRGRPADDPRTHGQAAPRARPGPAYPRAAPRAAGQAHRGRSSRWSATPMPASRRCSTG